MVNILQLKVTLEEITPTIWRRVLVEDSVSFQKLHQIIQKLFDWEDYHLYEFTVGNEKIMPDEAGYNPAEASFHTLFNSPEFKKLLEEQDLSEGRASLDTDKINKLMQGIQQQKKKNTFDINTTISKLLTTKGQKFSYLYDFGDNWEHTIIVEDILENDTTKKYPICTDGKRASPPEDCGGVPGYYHLLKVRKDKKHKEYKSLIVDWLGEDYEPNLFVLDWVNAVLHGKKPKPVWMKNEVDDDFIPLGKLLQKDTDEIKQITTLFNREEEYSEYFGEIESTIAEYYLENRKLKDKDVENVLQNIKKNYLQDIEFFKEPLEKELMEGLSIELEYKSITHHEFKLIIDYLIWAIDNRSWMGDTQAYVKWLPYFLGIYDDNEMKRYADNLKKTCRRKGVPEAKIKEMLENTASLSDEELEESERESEYFALPNDKKFDFVVKHGLEDSYLFHHYLGELQEKMDFATIEKLCRKMMEMTESFPLFEFYLGLNYKSLKNDTLAKYHIENAIATLESTNDSFSEGEKANLLKTMKAQKEKLSL